MVLSSWFQIAAKAELSLTGQVCHKNQNFTCLAFMPRKSTECLPIRNPRWCFNAIKFDARNGQFWNNSAMVTAMRNIAFETSYNPHDSPTFKSSTIKKCETTYLEQKKGIIATNNATILSKSASFQYAPTRSKLVWGEGHLTFFRTL